MAESQQSGRRLTHRGHVDGRRGLVHDEDAALSDERPGQTEQLPLADAEVLPALRHHGVCTEGTTGGFRHGTDDARGAADAFAAPSPPGRALTMFFS